MNALLPPDSPDRLTCGPGQPRPASASVGFRARTAGPDATVGTRQPPSRRRWSSRQLLGDEHEIEIAHADSVYRLRLTSLGKLILTK